MKRASQILTHKGMTNGEHRLSPIKIKKFRHMKISLRTTILSLLSIFLFSIGGILAQDITRVEASNPDISDHLDLEAVASLFGDSKDLEDFERRLNDPKNQISNLDLNGDQYVDYLRIVELTEKRTHLIAIQAVLGEDQYQDVATIEIDKDYSGNTSVQVVGDVYMYGPNYIIEPVYRHRPVFFSYFWRPVYHPYHSSYYWGYYPHYFHFWHPLDVFAYRRHIHIHINTYHSYNYVNYRRSHTAMNMHNQYRRNDYGRRNPNRSYATRTNTTRRPRTVQSRPTSTSRPRVTNPSTRPRTVGTKNNPRTVQSKPRTISQPRIASSPRSVSTTTRPRTVQNRPITSQPRVTNPSTRPRTSRPRTSTQTRKPTTKSRSYSSHNNRKKASKRSSRSSSSRNVTQSRPSRSTSSKSSRSSTSRRR